MAVATVIAAESTRSETFGKLLLSSIITIVLYWVAHTYAHYYGSRFKKAAEWSLPELAVSLAHEASILVGAAFPAVVLLVAWAAGASAESAVNAVLWAAVFELFLLELVVGIRNRLRVHDLAFQTAISIILGGGVLGLHVLLK